MTQPAKKTSDTPQVNASNDSSSKSSSHSPEDVNKLIKGRQSREIVVGLCGPIGSELHGISNQVYQILESEGYEVVEIRISKQILAFSGKANIEDNKAARYNALMDIGNDLREAHGDAICANLAINAINRVREKEAREAKAHATQKNEEPNDDTHQYNKQIALKKRAYIINQLKHPDEVEALKGLYRGMFYLVGILCDERRRLTSLTSEGIEHKDAQDLILRDKKENSNFGQQLEKTMLSADLFINNSDPNSSSTASLFSRFLKLIHGQHGITPTKQEIGMYSAYSASMQSACLSRQVGAAIFDKFGNSLAVGRNDVPKYGGGLYSEDDHITPQSKDYRCIHRDQRCHNDMHKLILKGKITEQLNIKAKENVEAIMKLLPASKTEEEQSTMREGLVKILNNEKTADNIYKKTPIKNLIEYSRAIHAEMDALMSLTRSNRAIEEGSILYTTTYPCHNCARHIIASGIEKVIYIEPYEKSLAIKLHDDALCHSTGENKVHLIPFQGVSPRRYQIFFSNTSPKKAEDGRVIISDKHKQYPLDDEFVDSYIEQETIVSVSIEALKKPQK